MPLPRFYRLAADRRAEILRVARQHFARDGKDGASYNRIIADAQLSKTSAYQYFDGKDDLAAAVLSDVNERVLAVLGAWTPAASAAAFWDQLKSSSLRMIRHVATHADDLAILHTFPAEGDISAHAWFAAVLDNAVALGLVRDDADRGLLLAATVGFFNAADAWALAAIARGAEPAMDQVWRLLKGLWGAPEDTKKVGRPR